GVAASDTDPSGAAHRKRVSRPALGRAGGLSRPQGAPADRPQPGAGPPFPDGTYGALRYAGAVAGKRRRIEPTERQIASKRFAIVTRVDRHFVNGVRGRLDDETRDLDDLASPLPDDRAHADGVGESRRSQLDQGCV